MRELYNYVITRDLEKVKRLVKYEWEIYHTTVVGWKEPDQDGVVRAVETEYYLRKSYHHREGFTGVETK